MNGIEIISPPICYHCAKPMIFDDIDRIPEEGYVAAKWKCAFCDEKITDVVHYHDEGIHYHRKLEFSVLAIPSDLYADEKDMTGVLKYRCAE